MGRVYLLDKKLLYGVVFLLSLVIATVITRGQLSGCSYTTCATYGCIYIEDSTTNTRAIFDGGGFLDIEGTITQSSVGTPNGTDFIIENSGPSTVAWIDDVNGNMRIAGTVTDDTKSYCTPPANSFVVRDSSGNCVSYIDSSGNVWLRGRLCYSSPI